MPRQHRHALRLGVATILLVAAATPASAAPLNSFSTSTPPAVADPSGGISALADEVRRHTALAPAVTVAADATWDVELTELVVTPKPAPAVEVVLEDAAPLAAPVEDAPAASPTAPPVVAEPPVAATPVAVEVAQVEPEPEVVAFAAPAPASGSLYDIAAAYIGTPYVSGGTSPSGFDCSGFTQFVYAQAGLSLPRSSAEQRNVGTVISRDQAVPGDLIWSPGHVAIYAGGNQQIDAPKPGASVSQRAIWQSSPTFIRVG